MASAAGELESGMKSRNLSSENSLIGIVARIPHMKRIWEILFFAFFIFCMFLFKPRQDLVFAAIDESQYIRLFEEDNDFVLGFDENKIFTGTYSVSKDTVFLKYRETAENDPFPPGRLYINKSESSIESADGKSFSAEIYMDIRHRAFAGQSAEEWELINPLGLRRTNLSEVKQGKSP